MPGPCPNSFEAKDHHLRGVEMDGDHLVQTKIWQKVQTHQRLALNCQQVLPRRSLGNVACLFDLGPVPGLLAMFDQLCQISIYEPCIFNVQSSHKLVTWICQWFVYFPRRTLLENTPQFSNIHSDAYSVVIARTISPHTNLSQSRLVFKDSIFVNMQILRGYQIEPASKKW